MAPKLEILTYGPPLLTVCWEGSHGLLYLCLTHCFFILFLFFLFLYLFHMLVLGLLNKFAEFLKLLILSLWEARPGGGWAWGGGGEYG